MDGNLSFNVAQLPSLKELLETVAGRKILMPSRKKFMATLDERFAEMKSTLKDILSHQKYLCITCDVWSSRAQSYLGVTVHFLNSSFVRESYVLAFKQLHRQQTYKELAQELDAIFVDFGIRFEQVTNIVTDGGSSFCKMFRIFGNKVDYTIQQEEQEADDEDDVNNETNDTNESNEVSDHIQSHMQTDDGELFATEILDFNIDESSQEAHNYIDGENSTQEPTQILMPPQRRCFSHLLNLISQDFEKKLPVLAKASFVAAYNKIHSVWVLTHRSSRAKDICKTILGCALQVPCETRWNSKYDALFKINDCKIQPKINTLIARLRADIKSAILLQPLSHSDFNVIGQYLKILEPVATSLDLLQGEFNCSQGYILPVLTSMKHRVAELAVRSDTIGADFKKTMLEVIEGRFKELFKFNEQNQDLILASISVPAFKDNFIENDEDFIYSKQLLVAECKKLSNNIVQESDNIRAEEPTQTSTFFVSFASRRAVRRSSLETEIDLEVPRFLMDDRSNINILNEYPMVREVYFKYNTTLSSSAAVERVFSQSMMIFTPRRNRLSAKNFEQTLLLKHNRKIIINKPNHIGMNISQTKIFQTASN